MSQPARAVRPASRRWLMPAIVLGVLGAGAGWYLNQRDDTEASAYRTEAVERGENVVVRL